jgi:hypothetical protein
MYFSEPLTNFRARLYSDDDQGVDIDFDVDTSVWHVSAEPGIGRETLRLLVRYLHDQFYRGEQPWLDDWMKLVDGAKLERPLRLRLKTVDRLVGPGEERAEETCPPEMARQPSR